MISRTLSTSTLSLGPNIQILFDRQNHRLQITNFRNELWRWNGDSWYYAPFLRHDDDFLHMTRFFGEVAGAPMEIEAINGFGPVVRLSNWPATMFTPKTAIVFHPESSEVEVHPPDPTDGTLPHRHYAFFLHSLSDFHNWSIMLGKLSRQELRSIPEHGSSTVDKSTRMFCFM